MKRKTILLADDHAVLREGLVRLLESAFDVVGAVGDGRTVVAEAERLQPDAVVLDVGLPLLNGLEAATKIRSTVPATKIVILTQHARREYVTAGFRAGASAYLLKNAAAAELVRGLEEAFSGRRYLCNELRSRYGDPDVTGEGIGGELIENPLTPRQREVLQLVAEGKIAKEIAHILNVSVRTVEFHKAAIMDELGLRSTAELTRYAIDNGIITHQ